jgi:hypothetical protein
MLFLTALSFFILAFKENPNRNLFLTASLTSLNDPDLTIERYQTGGSIQFDMSSPPCYFVQRRPFKVPQLLFKLGEDDSYWCTVDLHWLDNETMTLTGEGEIYRLGDPAPRPSEG